MSQHAMYRAPKSWTRRTIRGTAALLAGVVLAGCGSDSDSASTSSTSATSSAASSSADAAGSSGAAPVALDVPVVAFTTDVQPTYVNTRSGPIEFGPTFGLNYSEDDLKVFESHTVATQTALSGEAQIVGGSFISTVVLQQQGLDMQVFCPFNNSDTLALVGRNGVDSVDDLFAADTRVATDSPGGAGAMVMDALLKAKGAPGLIKDLPNTTILESSSLRANAFAADQVDVAVIHIRQFNAAAEQVPDGIILATLADDVPEIIMQAFSAPAEWLAGNSDAAVAFCASIISANRALKADYATFDAAVKKYVAEPGTDDTLKGIFEVIQRSDIWPQDAGITPEMVEYMTTLATESDVLSGSVDLEAIVNFDILDAAVALADSKG